MDLGKIVDKQKGSGIIVLVLILVLIVITGFTGWCIWRSKQIAGDADSTAANGALTEQSVATKLANGSVAVMVPSLWKPATGGYFSVSSGRCGQTVYAASQLKCVDHLMLILKAETFTNPDQFHVDISVFERPTGGSAGDWLASTGNTSEVGGKLSFLAAHGHTIAKYSVGYGDSETRVYYGIVSDKYGVLITAIAFKGDYYSYKNTANVNYLTYLPDIEMLAKSITIQNN